MTWRLGKNRFHWGRFFLFWSRLAVSEAVLMAALMRAIKSAPGAALGAAS